MEFVDIIAQLSKNSKPGNREGMERFAITADRVYGTGLPFVRNLAKQIKKETDGPGERNALAKRLWAHGAHETKLLSSIVAEPDIGWDTVEKWLGSCQNWAEVDQLCMNLAGEMDGAGGKALEYSKSGDLWRKRAGFVIMAVLAMRQKGSLDAGLSEKYFKAIARESTDERNFVKKAVNWALRHLGKLVDKPRFDEAVALSRKLAASDDKTARWIGKDALRELNAKGPPKGRNAAGH
jgi:3-methyladenine DNA glycosylase AlkD